MRLPVLRQCVAGGGHGLRAASQGVLEDAPSAALYVEAVLPLDVRPRVLRVPDAAEAGPAVRGSGAPSRL